MAYLYAHIIVRAVVKYLFLCLFALLGVSSVWASYSTPDTGVSWTMDDLVANSGGDVTGTAPNYTLHDNVFIKESDALTIPAGTTITCDDSVGWFTLVVQGTLLAKGIEASPILITSGDVRGGTDDYDRALEIHSTVSSNSVIEWVICEKADYGIYVNADNSLTIKNCTFRNNNRGVYACGQITFDGCTIENNGSESRPLGGAGITINDTDITTASVVLTNCTVRNNHAYGENSGGGINLRDGDLLVTDCEITGNNAAWGGGIIVNGLDVQSDIQILNSLIKANIATDGGGGIYLSDYNETDSSMLVSNCTIRANQKCSGAGIFASRASPVIMDCIVENNETDAVSGSWAGGGLAFQEVIGGLVEGCEIKNNSAQYGGGMNLYSCSSTSIKSCRVLDNWFVDYDLPDRSTEGINVESSTNVVVKSCEIDDKVFYWQSSGEIRNNLLFYMGMTDSSPLIANNRFSYISNGFSLYFWGNSDPLVENNIFSEGAFMDILEVDSNPQVRYNVFTPPLNTNGVYWYEYNDAWLDMGGMNDLAECSENFSADPLFAAETDFHLKSHGGRWDAAQNKWVFDTVTSPCLDAGNPSSVYTNEVYPNGGRINIGPYGNTTEASKTYLSLFGTDDSVVLQWLDRYDGESGFNVYRSSSPDEKGSLVGTAGANAFIWTDSSISFGQVYYYRVYADFGGTESAGYADGRMDTSPGVVQFSSSLYSAYETSGMTTIIVERVSGDFGAVSFNYFTQDGTAVTGSDYLTATGTLSLAHGETNAQFTIEILQDALAESNETVNLVLEKVSGMASPGITNAVLQILDGVDSDGDGMPDAWENTYGLNPEVDDANDDKDGDGLTNIQELQAGTNPNDTDSDNDGLTDADEVNQYGTDPLKRDSDGDGRTDAQEVNIDGTNPLNTDSDSDGMPDGWEISNGLDPLVIDANDDADSDELSNADEYTAGTNPKKSDTDSDDMPDGWEVASRLNPIEIDSWRDADDDGVPNAYEYAHDTDPNVSVDFPSPDFYVDALAASGGDGSVDSPFKTISSGINACTSDWKIVQIKAGTYKGTGNKNITFGGKKIMLRGDGMEDTTIDCEGAGYALLFRSGEDFNTIIAGLKFTGGTGWSNEGGAIACYSYAPSILKCTFLDNSVSGDGGALWYYFDGWENLPEMMAISECQFEGNQSGSDGGAIYISAWGDVDNVLVEQCVFSNNTSESRGGAIYQNHEIKGPISKCFFDSNSSEKGGAIWLDNKGELNQCVLNNNFAALNGGAVYHDGNNTAWLNNCLIYSNNAASSGGAVYSRTGSTRLSHCTITANSDSSHGCVFRGTAILKNTVLEDSSIGNVTAYGSCLSQVANSGNGNIYTSPIFESGSYELADSSPCIDAGALEHSSKLDKIGIPRPLDGNADGYAAPDIGCYEYVNPHVDTDEDGLLDVIEINVNLNPLQSNIGLDSDFDGLDDLSEVNDHLTDPLDIDTDDDGLSDAEEVQTHSTNPLESDSDGDGASDKDEIFKYFTNPLNVDTDEDGLTDWQEIMPAKLVANFNDGSFQGFSRNFPGYMWAVTSKASLHGNMSLGMKEYWNYTSWIYIEDNQIGNSVLSFWGKNLELTPGDRLKLVAESSEGEEICQIDILKSGWQQNLIPIASNVNKVVFKFTHDTYGASSGNPPCYVIDSVMLLGVSSGHVTDPLNSDSDADGLQDGWEFLNYLNATQSDAGSDYDADGLSNEDEFANNTLPFVNDTDGDGISDGDEINLHGTNPLDADSDADGLSDETELNTHYTDPLDSDSDGDGLSDGAEVNIHGTSPLKADSDNDQLSDKDEIDNGLDPLISNVGVDSDTDGLSDADEVNVHLTDPLDPDSDDDGLIDGDEVNQHQTNPLSIDSDADTMPDKWEIDNSLNPIEASDKNGNPDGDDWVNWREYEYGLNPHVADGLPDSDGDSLPDLWESKFETDPDSPSATPAPLEMSEVCTFAEELDVTAIDVIDDTLFVAANGIYIFDIVDPNAPILLSTFTNVPVDKIWVDDTYIYACEDVYGGAPLHIYERVGRSGLEGYFDFDLAGKVKDIEVTEDSFYVGVEGSYTNEDVYVFDKNPLPQISQSIDLNSLVNYGYEYGGSLNMFSNRLVVTHSSAGNAATFTVEPDGKLSFEGLLCEVTEPTWGYDVVGHAVSGGYLYRSYSDYGKYKLEVYELENEQFVLRQRYIDVPNFWRGFAVFGDSAVFISDGFPVPCAINFTTGNDFISDSFFSLDMEVDGSFLIVGGSSGCRIYSLTSDTDADGMDDGWEVSHFGNLAQDQATDYDQDGILDWGEYQANSNPNSIDSDGDGLPDEWEVNHDSNPANIFDGSWDFEGDGMPNRWEFVNGLDPVNDDADDDFDNDDLSNTDECKYVMYRMPEERLYSWNHDFRTRKYIYIAVNQPLADDAILTYNAKIQQSYSPHEVGVKYVFSTPDGDKVVTSTLQWGSADMKKWLLAKGDHIKALCPDAIKLKYIELYSSAYTHEVFFSDVCLYNVDYTDPQDPDSDSDGQFDGFEVSVGSNPLDPASYGCRLLVGTAGHGSVNVSNHWKVVGGTQNLIATPALYNSWNTWMGDTNAITAGSVADSNITVTLNTDVSLAAHFVQVITENHNVPHQWLADQGFDLETNDPETVAATDHDNDGYTTAQEYVLGTSPTNAASTFAIAVKDPNGFEIEFNSQTGRLYSVEYTTNLASNNWDSVTNNVSGTGELIDIVDEESSNARFYRVKVELAE